MVLFSSLLVSLSASAECPSNVVYPIEGWSDNTESVLQSKATEIAALEKYMFTLEGKDTKRIGIRTDGMVIVQHGEIIYENYGRGFTQENPHLMWSVAKSVNSALVGRAVQEGYMTIDDGICEHYADVDSGNCDIQVVDLLRFSSGLDFNETYEGEKNQASSVLAMLYGEGSEDMARFVGYHESAYPPGEKVAYSTGDATLLAKVLYGAVYDVGEYYPWDLLFDPLGMSSAVFERDNAGTYVGGSYVYFTPRDAAKFGYFYLNNGCWDDIELLPSYWVFNSTNPSQPIMFGGLIGPESDVSGWSWWTNKDIDEHGYKKWLPDAPEDTYTATGHWGQYIIVIPSWDLVIVRTGDDRDKSLDVNEFVQLAMDVATNPNGGE